MRVHDLTDATPLRSHPVAVPPKNRTRNFAAEARKTRKERFARMRAIASIANRLDTPYATYRRPGAFLDRVAEDLDRGRPTTVEDVSPFHDFVTNHRGDAIYVTEIVADTYGKSEANFVIAIRFAPRAAERFQAVMLPLKGSYYVGVMEPIPDEMK